MAGPGPLQRPPNARPRHGAEHDVPPAPTAEEQLRIEAQLVGLAELAGATVLEPPELGARLVTWPGRGVAFNYLAAPRWAEADWRARSAAAARQLRALGQAPAIVVVDELDRPAGLAGRLAAEGWLEVGGETILWTRRAATVPHLASDLRIEAVTPARAAAYEAVERAIFGVAPADAADRVAALERALAGGRLRAYLVRCGDGPIATARLVAGDGLASLHGVGVVASRRRAGYGALITTVATRAGLATGNALVWLSLDPANIAARRLYGGLAYRPVLHWRRLLAPPTFR